MSVGGDGPADRPDRLGGDEDDPALAGVAVAVASVLSTVGIALLLADQPLARLADESGATISIPPGNQIGWAYLAAHGVPITIESDRWMLAGELVPSPLVYAVPPVTLFLGGYLIARMDERTTPVGGFRAGSLTSIGYALFAILAVVGTRHAIQSSFADVRIWADPLRGVAAGLIYPISFGGSGGLLAAVVRSRSETTRRRVERLGLTLVLLGLLAAWWVTA